MKVEYPRRCRKNIQVMIAKKHGAIVIIIARTSTDVLDEDVMDGSSRRGLELTTVEAAGVGD